MSDDLRTPLYDLHVELGAKMVPFAGYAMPVQYPMGVMGEHNHTRDAAGLFDVSHMGQVILSGASWDAVAQAFETLVPQDVVGLGDGRQRYGFFTNDAGGIEDDLMFARRGDDLLVVVNAACKGADIARMNAALAPSVTVTELADRALVAVQGPGAEAAVAALDARAADMRFMDVADLTLDGVSVWASRSGYTGEDGYEISVPAAEAEALVRTLLAQDGVAPIGLGARDSLRLEAGLCLYGHDIDTTTTPAEAAPARKRVGLLPEGRAPMREGVAIYDSETATDPVGHVTSGGFGPSVGGPVAMGYVNVAQASTGTPLWGEVRGKRMPVQVAAMPFVPANFKR